MLEKCIVCQKNFHPDNHNRTDYGFICNWCIEYDYILALTSPDDEMSTCYECSEKDECRYAFDPWNHDGNCLASK